MSSIKSAPDSQPLTACNRRWPNTRLATLNPAFSGLCLIENGVITVQDSHILYVGAHLPFPTENAAEIIDCGDRWITPGLTDFYKAHGLPVKLHADRLSNLHGAALAAEYGAQSADHLEYTDEAGAAAMAKNGTVTVIPPGAFYFIRETKKPPVELFRKAGVVMAIATNNNPRHLARDLAAPDHEDGSDPVRHDSDGLHCRRVAGNGARFGSRRRGGDAGARKLGRFRHLEYRATGRTRLPHGLQPAACARPHGR